MLVFENYYVLTTVDDGDYGHYNVQSHRLFEPTLEQARNYFTTWDHVGSPYVFTFYYEQAPGKIAKIPDAPRYFIKGRIYTPEMLAIVQKKGFKNMIKTMNELGTDRVLIIDDNVNPDYCSMIYYLNPNDCLIDDMVLGNV